MATGSAEDRWNLWQLLDSISKINWHDSVSKALA
jgi:hypothetical protein